MQILAKYFYGHEFTLSLFLVPKWVEFLILRLMEYQDFWRNFWHPSSISEVDIIYFPQSRHYITVQILPRTRYYPRTRKFIGIIHPYGTIYGKGFRELFVKIMHRFYWGDLGQRLMYRLFPCTLCFLLIHALFYY